MYRRAPTLIEHQQVACEALGFRWALRHSAYRLDAEVRYFTDLLTWA
jgi:hypothetical protein